MENKTENKTEIYKGINKKLLCELIDKKLNEILNKTDEDIKDELKMDIDADQLESLNEDRVNLDAFNKELALAEAYYSYKTAIAEGEVNADNELDMIETICIEVFEEQMEWD